MPIDGRSATIVGTPGVAPHDAGQRKQQRSQRGPDDDRQKRLLRAQARNQQAPRYHHQQADSQVAPEDREVEPAQRSLLRGHRFDPPVFRHVDRKFFRYSRHSSSLGNKKRRLGLPAAS